MGYNNGYDAGYDDAKAELMPKIKALEAQLASAGNTDDANSASYNYVYAPGPSPSGSGTAPGPVAIGTIGPSTGPVALTNNALTVVSIDATFVPVGGWEDRATTGANRPDPVLNDYIEGWDVPEWDWMSDGFFNTDTMALTESPRAYESGDGSGTIVFDAAVRVSFMTSFTIMSIAEGSGDDEGYILVTVRPSDMSETNDYETVLRIQPYDGGSGGYVESSVSLPGYGSGTIISDFDPSGYSQGDTCWLWWEMNDDSPMALTYTPKNDYYTAPSGFKLVVPEADGNKPRKLQALLTVNGTGGVNVSGILEAPQGTTLVKDTSVTTGHVSSGSGDSTLISFVETVPGTVAVATLNAPASSILPQSNS